MASIKLKFRSSAIEGKKGSLYYQVIHSRVIRQVKTSYRIFESEWDAAASDILLSETDEDRNAILLNIKNSIQSDLGKFTRITAMFDRKWVLYTSDDLVSAFVSTNSHDTFFEFAEEVIANLKKIRKARTAETYTTTLNSFRRFRNGNETPSDMIDSDMILEYEAYLKTCGVSLNSSAFYMRNMRAIYNRAVDKELTPQRFPFKHVHTGINKTIKRAVSLKVVRKIKEMDLSQSPNLDFARDIFLFSFYTRGMSLVDISYLRKNDLSDGVLSYRRRKTGQQLFIKWEKPMQELVDKYDTSNTIYLLPIIKRTNIEERRQYIYAGHNINRNLKILGRKLGLPRPLTMYVARHAWASIAKSKNVPPSVISEGMGHDSETTTRIYLASLDSMAIDKANKMILKSLKI